MRLTSYIQDLLEKGQVAVASQLIPFREEDLQQTLALLQHYHAEDAQEMPLAAPEFSPDAAIWAAKYLYYATQFTMLRDLGDEQVLAHLTEFTGPLTPEAIYSADLTLRYLPDVLHLAKGLAPDDVLVKCMKNILAQWPFSSVGMTEIEQVNNQPVLEHDSLKYAYIDRIIKHKDIQRAGEEPVAELIREALGEHSAVLWPGINITETN
jgi:hypothetical protein